ncbi:hypothetical protein RhiirA4_473258 [Rhizophagus irregularis]|uniref:Uncharacterized protein n=1 Tax=Rhizophagus irregularis TaxID=588596 RepID=A0A2I1H6D1_9GLOM|nr:hypothetical protein RhiirA4_473258 [Rhizophagus irregularis]
MERVINELLNNKDFVDFLHNNFLYTNGPSFFKILEQAIKKHETAPQRLKHHTQDYLRETLTSLLERYDQYTPLPSSTPPSTPIVYKHPPAFPIRQVTRLPIRTPSNEFWIRSRHKLDAFLDTFRNLPAHLQITTNDSEDNFHFGKTHGTDNLFWHLNGFFGITLGPTFIRYCGTNRLWFLFKQPSIKDLDLIFDCAYTPRRKKDRDKVRYYGARISSYDFFLFIFFYYFLISYSYFISFSISFRFLLTTLYLDRAYYDGFFGVNMEWQLAVFNNLCCDREYPMLESNLYYTEHLSYSKWGLTIVNLMNWERGASTTAGQSWSFYAVNQGSDDLNSGSFSFASFQDALGRNDLVGPVDAL